MTYDWVKENKKQVIFAAGLLICLALIWLLYDSFGHQIIRAIYEGRVMGDWNIFERRKAPLEFYLDKTNKLLLKLTVLFCMWTFLIVSKAWKPKNPEIFFNYKNTARMILGLASVILLGNLTANLIRIPIDSLHASFYWPISTMLRRIPTRENCLVAILILLFFIATVRYLPKHRYKIWHIIFLGSILVLGTNLMQGWLRGMIKPIAGDFGYYDDVLKINDLFFFLSHFEQIRPTLSIHTQVHPPGPVLVMYVLFAVFKNPGLMNIAIAITSVSLSVFFLYKILVTEFSVELSRYMSFLFVLIPSIQIYYSATIDALIASFFLGVLYFALHPKTSISIIGSIFFLFLTSFLTFGFVFLLPVFVVCNLLRRRNLWSVCVVLCALGVIYVILYRVLGFNYINSFIRAAIKENPRGFKLFSDPLNYIFTRIEDIAEIILFFGPFLGALLVRGINVSKRGGSHLLTISQAAIVTLWGMLICGTFQESETARICLFIYPYLLFPVALYLEKDNFSTVGKNKLLYWVFSQTLFMQLVGHYCW